MDIRSAELTKYAANCMLATKISFINEMANICERLGADVNQVRLGIGSDERIGYHFIYPGVGYGGSCFPKDVSALIRTAEAHNYEPRILKSVEDVNRDQKSLIVKKIIHKYGEDLTGMIFAVWGLAFKPNTDDMREAPSIVIINELVKRGAIIRAYDPEATQQAKECYLKDVENIQYFDNKYDALYNADAMILVTEWKEFRSPVFEEIAKRLKGKDVFDGRNIYLKISGQNALNFFFIGK
jgi:UDPglucose 6-dehydrogenase